MEGDSSKKKKELAYRYWKFIKPYRFMVLLIIFLGIAHFVVPLSVPWMTKILIDQVLLGKGHFWTLQKVVSILAVVYLFGIIVNFIQKYITAHLGNKMAIDLKQQLYEHLQKLSPQFYDNHQIGNIVSRVQHDVNGAQNLVRSGVIGLVINLFMVFLAGFMLIKLDWKLALMSLWILPLYYLTFANFNVRIRFAWRSVHRQMARISGVLVERISGMKIVQSFNREPEEMNRFKKQTANHFKYAMSAQILSNTLGSITTSFNNIGNLIIWFIGGLYVLDGQMTIGALVAFQGYLTQLYNPIQQFANVNITVQNSMANVERIFEVFNIDPDIKNKENALPLKQCKGEITLHKVSFTYITERPETAPIKNKNDDPDLVEKFKPDKKFYWIPPKTKPDPPPVISEKSLALKNISFHVRSGEVVALVGASGAGKSTLINLIPRFYDPNEGHVLVDGVDIRDYDLADLRRQIALVLQDNILFSGSVYENISYSKPEASEKEVIAAAKAAYAHDFISEWEKGYGTILGERGVRLSGGQKQRIAIARALLKNPRILILDEATSALDAESEAYVTAALEELMKQRTTFIIAHRLATVVRADQILVMNNGGIVERGTHAELLKQGGAYRELYEKQLKAMRPEELQKLF